MRKGIIIALILVMLILLSSIDYKVKASTYDTLWVPLYSDSNRTQLLNTATITSNTNNNFTTTRFYFERNRNLHYFNGKDYTGGQMKMPFTLTVPILNIQNTNTIYGTDTCDRWKWYTMTTNENVTSWNCDHWTSNNDSTIVDREYIYPTMSIKASLHTSVNNVDFYVSCQIKDNAVFCPIGSQQQILEYIDIETNVQYGVTNTRQYTFTFDNFVQIEYDGTTSAIENQTQQQQQQHNEIMNTNQTYEDELDENINGTSEIQEYTNMEDQLFENIETNTTALDGISINPNASTFIWEIVNGLRNMNPSIITLITSILGLGIVKLVLNR